MARTYSFGPLEEEYASRWASMRITPGKVTTIDAVARKIIAGKARYQAVEADTGVPWAFIGVLHNREAGCDFAGVLHNGEQILGTGRKTKLVPAGRGPFKTWHEAAIDALKIKGYKIGSPVWSIARCLFEGERFNGFGYRMHGVPSAYLWSFSDQYKRGKYVADGVWNATTVDRQMGIAPLMARLMVLDPDVSFGGGDLPREWATSPVAPPADSAGPAPPINPDDGLNEDEVREIQKLLRAKKYFGVGRVDGLWGPSTAGALRKFQEARGLPTTVTSERAWVDAATIAALVTGPDADVSKSRATTTAATMRQHGDAVAKASWWTKAWAWIMGAPAAAVGIVGQTGDAADKLGPVKAFLGDIPMWAWGASVAAIAVALYVLAQRTENAAVADVRSGRDAGPA